MKKSFTFNKTTIDGVKTIHRNSITDNRGSFSRLFSQDDLSRKTKVKSLSQINLSKTNLKGTIRGLHCQIQPFAETKIVICIKGKIFDVAVDLRSNSRTLYSYHAEILSGDDCKALLIPEGMAHGFQTLSENCELIYMHTAPYNVSHERKFNPFDPKININWPLELAEISESDMASPFIDEKFSGLSL